jgi:cell wall-associated NlpC family hydrolase
MSKTCRFLKIAVPLLSSIFLTVAPVQADQIKTIGYTIQAGAFQELPRAELFAEKLRERKLDAVYFKKENGYFAVTFGNYPTWDAASQNARKLKQERLIEDFYIVKPRRPPETFDNRSSAESLPKRHDTDRGKLAALTAERFKGIHYKYGGNTVVEGLDCSAFVKSVYYLIGIDIPRTSQEQFDAGLTIDKKELQEGDLLFFGKGPGQISHVGMYLGNGKFIHAPRRGEPIQITPVDNEKYVQKYVGSRRFL